MNCANHPDRERSAFCQNCGKPLCTECIRNVGTSVFCEPCYNLRSATPPVGVPPVAPFPSPGAASPGLAALLGIIPGVGAMYNGQYAKGVVHLVVFAILVSLSDQNGIFGLFVAGWIAYMVIEAHHTARARRDGTPLPNPFGLNDLGERLGFGKSWSSAPPPSTWVPPVPPAGPADPTHSNPYTPPPASNPYTPPYAQNYAQPYPPPAGNWGAPQDSWGYPVPPVPPMTPGHDPNLLPPRRFPTGAIWLIALGILFLLGNTGLFFIRARFVGPLILIALGVWVFVRRMTCTGQGIENDGTPGYNWRLARACSGAIWLVAIGLIWMLDSFRILSWARSWPLFLIIAGILLFLKRSVGSSYSGYSYPPYPGAPAAPVPPPTPGPAGAPSTSIVPAPERPVSEEGR